MATRIPISDKTRKNTSYRKILYKDTTDTTYAASGLFQNSSELEITTMYLKKNKIVPLEMHDTHQIIHIMSGRLLVLVSDGPHETTPLELKVGDMCVIKPNVWHELHVLGSQPVKLYSIYH